MSVNPYAPPAAEVELVAADRCWRDTKDTLYIAQGSDLPRRCVKCNAPVTMAPKKRTLYWHAAGWYVLVLLNIILYAIAAMVVRKKIQLSPALCSQHAVQRRNRLLGGLGVFLAGLLAGVAAFGNDAAGIGLAAFAIALGALIFTVLATRTVFPVEIHDKGARIKGCGEAFLASLSRDRLR